MRFDSFCSLDYDFSRDQSRLHLDDYLDSIAQRLAEDANILDGTALVKRFDILLHGSVVKWLAHLCPHVRQNVFLAHRGWTGVLDVDRSDDGTRRNLLWSLLWILRLDRWHSQQRANKCDPGCCSWGAHPSRKVSHRLRSAIPRKHTHAGQAPISGRRWQSSRRDFTQMVATLRRGVRVAKRDVPTSFNSKVRTNYSGAAVRNRHHE